ncbi:hypothetical protein OIU74_005730 [Salix koriyanagi]|uniref:Uncharacterized protein n=1 Tax=Salix koriyanagi TaxID=2511006 RepID=A0A9Q0UQ52_9ROSI|nr:hypothetical protein OIU74_005730 [Salix koriyanagi]
MIRRRVSIVVLRRRPTLRWRRKVVNYNDEKQSSSQSSSVESSSSPVVSAVARDATHQVGGVMGMGRFPFVLQQQQPNVNAVGPVWFLESVKPELVAQRFPVRFDPVGLEGGAQSDSDSSSVIDFKPRRSIRDLDLNLPPPADA